jgi:hypothetical protein
MLIGTAENETFTKLSTQSYLLLSFFNSYYLGKLLFSIQKETTARSISKLF